MTAVVDRPRAGQVEELVDAIRERADNPETAPYWTGFIIGFTASFADDDVFTDALTDARRVMFAQAYTIRDAGARWQLLGRNVDHTRRDAYLKACGVLFGWKQGTAERDDAEECTLCEDRILTRVDDAVRCTVGWFCNEECHYSFDAGHCCKAERREGLL